MFNKEKGKKFIETIAHPNLKMLAQAILDGETDEHIIEMLGFDQAQIESMRTQLVNEAGVPDEQGDTGDTGDTEKEEPSSDDTIVEGEVQA